MPITTSVITGTVAHKHSASGGSGDGGKLATGGLGGDTSFDLANGSLMFSNGTSLEELPISGSGTVLTEAGGVPTWAAGGGSPWVSLGSDSSTGGTSALSVSFSAYDIIQALFHIGVNTTTTAYATCRVNNNSSSIYNVRNTLNESLLGTYTGQTAFVLQENTGANLDLDMHGEIILYKGNANLAWTGLVAKVATGTLNTTPATPQTYYTSQGSWNNSDTNPITRIDLLMSNGSNLYGDITVNGMNYA